MRMRVGEGEGVGVHARQNGEGYMGAGHAARDLLQRAEPGGRLADADP